jgi:hypothetical protein
VSEKIARFFKSLAPAVDAAAVSGFDLQQLTPAHRVSACKKRLLGEGS